MEGQLSYRKRPSQHNPRDQFFLHEFLIGKGLFPDHVKSTQHPSHDLRSILPYEGPILLPWSLHFSDLSFSVLATPTTLACTLRPQWALPLISSLEYLSSKHLQSRLSHHLWVFAGVSLAGKPKSDLLICNANFPQTPICPSLLEFSQWPLTPRDKTHVSLVYFACSRPSFL